MKRREVLSLLGSATLATWPAAAQGQSMKRIGVLMGTVDEPVTQARLKAFRQGLEKLKWTEGTNVRMDIRFGAGDIALIKTQIADIIALAPDVILGSNTPVVRALAEATQSIPIVFAGLADPVGDGIVASLARPGGNITGFTSFEAPISGKWLQQLTEIAPGLKRVAVLYNPETTPHTLFWPALDKAAPMMGVRLIRAAVRDFPAIESAIAAVAAEPGGGLLLLPDVFTTRYRTQIIELVARHRVPTIYPVRDWIPAGGLIAYSSDFNDQFRRAADHVDRILRGVKPADLAVQQPVKYEMALNLKTAMALGLNVPTLVLAQADEIID